MAWTVEVSDEFAGWYRGLDDDEHESVNFSVDLLEEVGPSLGRPHVDTVRDSRMPIGRNCGFNTRAGRTAFCLRSIHAAPLT
jgi:hypothetical protein